MDLRLSSRQKKGMLLVLAVLLMLTAWLFIRKTWLSPDISGRGTLAEGREPAPEDLCIDLNRADCEELRQLKGIGEVLCGRIISFRRSLGGFTRAEQLKEVYNLPAETYRRILPMVYADTTTAEFRALREGRKWEYKAGMDRSTRKDSSGAAPSGLLLDLNAADSIGLQQVPGIGPALGPRIVKYRARLGGFTNVEQLKDLYGMHPENYERMAPYLFVDTTNGAYDALRKNGRRKPLPQKLLPTTDLNRADSAALVAVKGIGPGTARGILWLRDRLGFFHSLKQLREIRGMRDENFGLIVQQVFIAGDLSAYPHLRINRDEVASLARHPYLDYNTARILAAFRDEHGPFKDREAMRAVKAVDQSVVDKIEPYLEF